MKLSSIAAAVALAPMTAGAVTHFGFDTNGGFALGFTNGAIYSDIGGSTLAPGITASVTVRTDAADAGSAVGFDFAPLTAGQAASVSLNALDASYYGMGFALSDDLTFGDADDIRGTVPGPGTLSLSGAVGGSPFYVLFDFTTAAGYSPGGASAFDGQSFAYDVAVTPLPAGVLLIGSAFAAAGIASRRRRPARA